MAIQTRGSILWPISDRKKVDSIYIYIESALLEEVKLLELLHANILKAWKKPSAKLLVTSVIQETGLQEEGSLEMVELQRMDDVKLSSSLTKPQEEEVVHGLVAEFADVCSSIPGLTD